MDFKDKITKYIGKEIELLTQKSDITKGVLIAVSWPHMNLIIKTDKKERVIRGSDWVEFSVDAEKEKKGG